MSSVTQKVKTHGDRRQLKIKNTGDQLGINASGDQLLGNRRKKNPL